MRRYLCSELVGLKREASNVEEIVSLEEIWTEGALIETEAAGMVPGEKAEIVPCGSGRDKSFAGRVTRVWQHEFGCRVEIEFSPRTRWDIETWRPAHLTDPESPGDI